MTQHATLGASSSERWISCPGSVRLSEGMPNTTSVYAQEGTAAHSLGERALRMGLDPEVWLDTVIEEVLVTEEMVEAVRVYVDYVRSRLVDDARVKTEMRLETRFDLGPMNPPAPMFGTADCMLWDYDQRVLEVIDYKHGQGVVVEAVGNTQFAYYALGAVLALGKRPKKIILTVVQPRAYHHEGPVRSHEITYDDLVAFKKMLFSAAELTQLPNAPLRAGDHCRFCPALPVCPEQQRHAQELAQVEFGTTEIAPPAPATLTHDELSLVLTHAGTLEEWIKAVRKHVSELIDTGVPVAGWKLVPKRATRKWKDEEFMHGYLKEAIGDAAFAEPKLLSPAQAEKELKKIGVKLDPEFVVKQSSGTNLVPDTDTRPALLPSAQEDFSTTL